jgi:hypothetical protein
LSDDHYTMLYGYLELGSIIPGYPGHKQLFTLRQKGMRQWSLAADNSMTLFMLHAERLHSWSGRKHLLMTDSRKKGMRMLMESLTKYILEQWKDYVDSSLFVLYGWIL